MRFANPDAIQDLLLDSDLVSMSFPSVGGKQFGQATPQGIPQQPYGGAPNVPLTPEEVERLLQPGAPIPPGFREQYLPKPGVTFAANQGPSTPVKFDEQMNMLVPNMGAGRPGQVRLRMPVGVRGA